METSGINFDVLEDGLGDELPIELEAKLEEPVLGVCCILKPKTKWYKSSEVQ